MSHVRGDKVNGKEEGKHKHKQKIETVSREKAKVEAEGEETGTRCGRFRSVMMMISDLRSTWNLLQQLWGL